MVAALRFIFIAISTFTLALLCTLTLVNSAQAEQASAALASSVPQSPLEPASSPDVALNWAGYVAQNGAYTSVTGTWDVPSVHSDGTEADATWVGIGGVTSHDLIQAGTEAVPGNAGETQYLAWYELLPDSSVVVPLTINSGDAITVSITESSPDTWLISMRDDTSGRVYTTTVNYRSSHSSAEWIEEMPVAIGTRVGLDDFGTVRFGSCYTIKNGSPTTIAGAGAYALGMADRAGTFIATPSVLGADGASFSVTRTTPPSTTPAPTFIVTNSEAQASDPSYPTFRRHRHFGGGGYRIITVSM